MSWQFGYETIGGGRGNGGYVVDGSGGVRGLEGGNVDGSGRRFRAGEEALVMLKGWGWWLGSAY